MVDTGAKVVVGGSFLLCYMAPPIQGSISGYYCLATDFLDYRSYMCFDIALVSGFTMVGVGLSWKVGSRIFSSSIMLEESSLFLRGFTLVVLSGLFAIQSSKLGGSGISLRWIMVSLAC
ncbi:hypothetical protein FGO68_gene14949 [Halteria grandinella]|uniref:Uncharacterized protein n=1 Tax=Halteria grandinella TaxID=5974 RepID=A0A8J8T696_HALGN|nr:hypothetical protein FGO68_gene14949 [Halteria grandinella]